MIKELKYFFYILTISLFIFLNLKYYFSDKNMKNSYRSLQSVEKKMIDYSLNLKLLTNDTLKIIEYIDNTDTKKKSYHFWKLLDNEK